MEIANAEEQLALLRLIMDKTWDAVAQQAEEQKKIDAQRKAQAKLKPRSRKPISIPKAPPPPPVKNPKPPLSKTPTPTNNLPNPNKDNTITPVRTSAKPVDYGHPITNPQLNPSLNVHPNTKSAPAQKASLAPKDGYFDKNIGVIKKDGNGDDRHSKNGIATLKKLPRSF